MASPRPSGPEVNLAETLLVAATVTSVVPIALYILGFSRAIWIPGDLLFALAPVAAAAALALALAGLLLLRSPLARTGVLGAATVLLGLNLVAFAYAGYSWFTSGECRYSGPCMTPLYSCGSGLVLEILVAVLMTFGLAALRRPPVVPLFVPPPPPPPRP